MMNLHKVPGIYQIKNLTTNKIYIGSAVNLYMRFAQHKSTLKNNKHCFRDDVMKPASEMLKKNRLVDVGSTMIEKTALEMAAVFYDAARSSGGKSKLSQRRWAAKNFEKFIPTAVKTLISMLGRSDISDVMKQEIHEALLERINDPEMIMLDELSQMNFQPTRQ